MHETILQTLSLTQTYTVHTVQHIGKFGIDVHDSVYICILYMLGTILGSSDHLVIEFIIVL